MRVSLELFLINNFLMNVIVMGVCARSVGQIHWGKVCFAAGFGTLYAAAMQFSPYRALAALPIRMLVFFLLTVIAFRADRLREVPASMARFAACTLFVGGVMYTARQWTGGQSWMGLLIAAPVAGIALLLATGERNRRIDQWEVRLMMRSDYGVARLSALIDTGNRLREPVSGLPVVIVEHRCVKRLLPAGFSLEGAVQNLPPGFRVASYGALGGGGKLLLMRPREIFLSYGEGWVRAPDIWVGLYPGKIPGQVQALAPPIIGRVQPAHGLRIG